MIFRDLRSSGRASQLRRSTSRAGANIAPRTPRRGDACSLSSLGGEGWGEEAVRSPSSMRRDFAYLKNPPRPPSLAVPPLLRRGGRGMCRPASGQWHDAHSLRRDGWRLLALTICFTTFVFAARGEDFSKQNARPVPQ